MNAILKVVVQTTYFLLGQVVGELAPMLAVLCMIGLAASARMPVLEQRPAAEMPVLPVKLTRPIPDPKPAPPERHPLDPDPDDVPLANPWPKR